MPLIKNPILAATLRRNWPLVGAVGFFALFMLVHQLAFQPAAKRYQKVVQEASDLGLPLDLTRAPALIPPRVLALVVDNALPPAEAQRQGSSGQLTASLLEGLTRTVNDQGLDVLATQPGAVIQQPNYVQVRAYVKARGRYSEVVSLMNTLATGRQLIGVDRFTLIPETSGRVELDLWVSRFVLKQERRKT
jgi:Type II secretion system (T2SS), protein M subtype b